MRRFLRSEKWQKVRERYEKRARCALFSFGEIGLVERLQDGGMRSGARQRGLVIPDVFGVPRNVMDVEICQRAEKGQCGDIAAKSAG